MEVKDTIIKLSGDVLDAHRDISELSLLCSRACKEIYVFAKRRYRLLMAAGLIYILVSENHRLEQNKKIDTLIKEVEELKDMKGD